MITKLAVASVKVLDQNEALDFYVNKLGLEVGQDIKQGSFRWLTVRVPGDPGGEILLEEPGPPLQVTVRRLPEDGAEAADEVRLGEMGHRGHGADVEWLGVGAVHGVAGAQQAPVQILDFAAHGATLRHPSLVATIVHGV